MTRMIAHPRYKPDCAVMTIARGEAMAELLHSSERWNGASKPERVYKGVRKPMMVAHGVGQDVVLEKVVQTAWDGLVLGL
jgi:hypothetical protein